MNGTAVSICIALIVGVAILLVNAEYWLFQGAVYGSLALAIGVAIRNRDHWPVEERVTQALLVFPAILIALRLSAPLASSFSFSPLVDWGWWLAWSVGIALSTTAALWFRWGRFAYYRWTLRATFGVVLAFSAWTLHSLNFQLPQPMLERTFVIVRDTNSGGYRQGLPRITIGVQEPFNSVSTHVVSLDTLIAAERGQLICMCVFRGGLGWQWVQFVPCNPDPPQNTQAP